MSATPETTAKKNWLPDTSRGFWRICLFVSLFLNLGMAGVVLGRVWHHKYQPGTYFYQQFAPGSFFKGLADDRRRELDAIFRSAKPEFDMAKLKNADIAGQIATALDKPVFDAPHVAALVDDFTTGPQSIASRGGAVLKKFYGALTPAERADLARAIRLRQARMNTK